MAHQKEVPRYIIEKYEVFGYSKVLIEEAYQICQNPENDNLMLDALDKLQAENEKLFNQARVGKQENNPGIHDEDLKLNEAILLSLQTAKEQNLSIETDNPIERGRKSGVPVGLKNIGNTCYFNSILQTYFMYPEFVNVILHFKEPNKIEIDDTNQDKQRIIASIKLVKALQNLFGMMILSKKKYVDPSAVLNSIVDDCGKYIPIGDQKDIGEFNLYFLARIEEGLTYENYKKSPIKSNIDEEFLEKSSDKLHSSQIDSSHNNDRDKNMRKLFSMTVMHEEHHLIFKLFFGKSIRYLKIDSEEQKNEQIEEEAFNMIILDLKHKDLYSSWEESMFEKIDDFRGENGKLLLANRATFIKNPPGTLLFQLQRVIFDKEKGITKINDKFHFEKEIYIDRLLDENKNYFLTIRSKVQKLKEKARMYEEAIQKICRFNSSDNNLITILKQAQNFLELQISENNMSQEANQTFNPTYFGPNNKEIGICLSNLENYRIELDNRLKNLETVLNEINKEIEESYSGLRNIKYRLLSILMHEGNADSGHYYSYICDFGQGIWRKYNDRIITESNEEILLKEAIGGENKNNAYCLIYVREEMSYCKDKMLPPRLYNIYEPNNIYDLYTSFLTESPIFKEIELDNLKYDEEIEEYKSRNIIRDILEEYQRNFEYVNELERKIKEKNSLKENKKIKISPLLNFCIYMKFELQNSDEICKYHLLNDALMKYTDLKLPLSELNSYPLIFQEKLKAQINNFNKFKTPSLTFDSKYYENKIQNYIIQTKITAISIYSLKKSLEEKFSDCFYAIDEINKMNLQFGNFFCKLNTELIKILGFFICSISMISLKEKNEIKFLELINLIYYMKKNYFSEKNVISVQINIILTEIKTVMKENKLLSDDIHIKIDKLLTNIETEHFEEEITLEIPEDFQLMIKQNSEENDPFRIEIFKKDDILIDNFNQNFSAFQSKYEKWCQLVKYFSKTSVPLMPNELELKGII